MIRTARLLLLSVLTTALVGVGVGAVQTSAAAEPQQNDTPTLLRSGAAKLLQRGEFRAAGLPGISAPSSTWAPDGSGLALAQNFDGALALKLWDPVQGWRGWFDLGAPIAGLDATAPSATWAFDNSRLDIFVKGGSDGHLYQKTITEFESDWVDLGGVLIDGPSATSAFGGRIDVFGIGTDSRLYQKTWTGSFWTGFVGFAPPAAGIGSAPSATWVGNRSRIDVFVTGEQDSALYQLSWVAGVGWTTWTNLGGVYVSPPAASWTNNGNRIDVFGVGTDFRLHQRSWLSSSGWTGFVSSDGPTGPLDNLGVGVSWVANGTRLDVVASGANDGHVYQLAWGASFGWSSWVDQG